MKIGDLNLLEVDIYDGENLIYNGMCEDVPENIKSQHIKITRIDGKKLILEIE